MSEIEEGVVEEQLEDLPTSEEEITDEDYSYDEEDSEYEEETGNEPQETERERLLQQRVAEQERIIQLMQNNQNTQQAPQEPEYDPEELVTNRDVDALLEKRLARIREETRQSQVSGMVQVAKTKFSDYDKVADLGKAVVGENAAMAQAIMASDNPPEMLYALGKTHPSYRPGGNVAGRIKKNLNKPKTLTDVGGGNPTVKKDWSTASKKEIEAEIRRVKGL